ncbi:hypothetical protein FRB91_000604 [Serendipita sp. 411]|nr:hypothetical protein FRB91_000604 [Serendipita sp. 411]KAG9046993.1 hypothetical protein FS842_000739 [Serendipita sp. 407]
MDSKIAQLVEMGATAAQARAALADHKDVMTAAEHIFDGKYDDVIDEEDEEAVPGSKKASKSDDEEDENEEMDEDDAEDDGDEDDEDDGMYPFSDDPFVCLVLI